MVKVMERQDCQHCEQGTIYNRDGQPELPKRWQCDECMGAGQFWVYHHDTCTIDILIPDKQGFGDCLDECPCGALVRIEGDRAYAVGKA